MEAEAGGQPVPERGRSLGRAVVCASEDGLRPHVVASLEGSGFEVLAVVDRGLDLLPSVADFTPDVVVLDIALVGTLGVRLLGILRSLAPGVTIIVLAPLRTFHVAALEAGADVVLPMDDLRGLAAALGESTGSARP